MILLPALSAPNIAGIILIWLEFIGVKSDANYRDLYLFTRAS